MSLWVTGEKGPWTHYTGNYVKNSVGRTGLDWGVETGHHTRRERVIEMGGQWKADSDKTLEKNSIPASRAILISCEKKPKTAAGGTGSGTISRR